MTDETSFSMVDDGLLDDVASELSSFSFELPSSDLAFFFELEPLSAV
jgi:hypothetical protein